MHCSLTMCIHYIAFPFWSLPHLSYFLAIPNHPDPKWATTCHCWCLPPPHHTPPPTSHTDLLVSFLALTVTTLLSTVVNELHNAHFSFIILLHTYRITYIFSFFLKKKLLYFLSFSSFNFLTFIFIFSCITSFILCNPFLILNIFFSK